MFKYTNVRQRTPPKITQEQEKKSAKLNNFSMSAQLDFKKSHKKTKYLKAD